MGETKNAYKVLIWKPEGSPDRLWGPPRLLSNGYQELFIQE